MKVLVGVGDLRFINGILGNYSRTIAFRLSEQENRIEPSVEAKQGLIGFPFAVRVVAKSKWCSWPVMNRIGRALIWI